MSKAESKPEEGHDQAERLRILTAEAEATVKKESETIKTRGQDNRTRVKTNQDKPQDNTGQSQDKRKKSKDKPQDKAQDSVKDSKTMETASYPENSVVSTPVSTVSRTLSQPESQPERAVSLSETDLEKERGRLLKLKVAAEMLQAGWAIRDVSTELRLSKGTVERVSKTLRKETSSDLRKKYLDKPYEYAVEKLEEKEEESESLLESGWFERMQRKIWKMKIEADLMRRAGLLGDGDGGSGSGQINIQQLLMAKILASSQTGTSNEELLKFASNMKNLFAPNENKDPIEVYTKLQGIQTSGVEQYRQISERAYAQAKAEGDRDFFKDLAGKGLEAVQPLLKGVLTKPQIPVPTAIAESGIPGPMSVDLESLARQGLPEGHVISQVVEQTPTLDLGQDQGYSNFDLLRGRTKIEKEVRT